MTKAKNISTLTGRLKERGMAASQLGMGVLLTVLLAVAGFLYAYNSSFIYGVYLNDEKIGFVTSDTVILDYIALLQEEAAASWGLDVRPDQHIRVERVRRQGASAEDLLVKEHLRQQLEYDVYAYLIHVNDKPTLAVRTYEEYQQVLDKLKNSFVSGRSSAVVREIVLNDRVEAKKVLVESGDLYSADKAVEILRRGTDRRETYLVSRGDSLWTIARNKGMTVAAIQAANPQLEEVDRLQIGDKINLVVPEPLVDISVTKVVELVERIPFRTTYQNDSRMYRGTTRVMTRGREGSKEVTYRIKSTNEREVQREVIKEVIVEEPQDQVMARGTSTAPVIGRGSFSWPMPSSFRITSKFGPRGRGFHPGVDIGAQTGTDVIAADEGVVVFAGWAGSYGILIYIDHGNGYVTKYAHNSRALVAQGQRVEKGQRIARSGNTGNSTGPHLHFEIVRNGKARNPLAFFRR